MSRTNAKTGPTGALESFRSKSFRKNFRENLDALSRRIESCERCPRLRQHCLKMAQEKRKSYRDEIYWGKPITGFGDPKAQILVVGLAPAAHGANRTGRIFTGDRSGDWLYRAMYRAGLANQPESVRRGDGLQLRNAWVTCVVRCAPPDNKPEKKEIKRCGPFLEEELRALNELRVVVALGGIALQGIWPFIKPGKNPRGRPKFGHAVEVPLDGGKTLLLSYHPSQQNTFTGRLTEPMLDSIFKRATVLAEQRA